MGKAIVKSQYLYVNSEKRAANESAYNLTINIPRNVFECDDSTQEFEVTLVNFSTIKSYYFVNESNNTFYINDEPITIEPGNYSYKQLGVKLLQFVQATTAIANATDIGVTYDAFKLKLKFIFPNANYNINTGSAYYLLGFENPNTVVNADVLNFTITSAVPMRSQMHENICLTIDNINASPDSLSVENVNGNVATISQNLLSIPDNFAPNDFIVFQNTAGLFSMVIKEKLLKNLVFSIRDELGKHLTFIGEWRACIRIDTLEDRFKLESDMLQALNEIKEYTRLNFMSKHLPAPAI